MSARSFRRALLALVATAAMLTVASPASAGAPSQPGQAATGFGSSQGYIATGATKYETGSGSAGTRVWWYVPNRLRNGTSAPVVVFLHGFMLLAPEIYQGHIDHLTRQGYIVIFPQFNKGGLLGLMTDTDQNQMLKRAIDATNVALARLGSAADRSKIHLYGHSLGGLMGASWLARGGVPIRSATLANPSLDAGAAIPSFVRSLVRITPIDIASTARSHTVRTIIITGDRDTIAKPAESLTLAGLMTAAPEKVVYQALSDSTGSPAIQADHMAPIQDDGWLPSFLAELFGGTGEQDTLDWRVYYAALDANIAGHDTVPFEMGTWSNGVPVAAPVRLL
ncbi:alpha/beta hydrolase [Rhabdothermincola sediminis]|uniref:alpha/beta hydrolase n=1 Tax=Rhabdothermincola sediminis TaxID=2751370 RepID=UPI001AA0605D|nr:alpha/beta hydrolase family protein [Rhabdothermincola sediminis]